MLPDNIFSVRDEEEGLVAFVFVSNHGEGERMFGVGLYDEEAGMVVPTTYHRLTLEDAKARAIRIALGRNAGDR